MSSKKLTDADRLPKQYRRATITKITPLAKRVNEAGGGEGEEDPPDDADSEYEVSLSSDEPVDRYFGREILDHDPKSVNLDRAKDGLPLLSNHSMNSVPIGRLTDLKADGKQLRATMKFNNTSLGTEWRAAVDGGHREMSIGYSVDQYDYTPAKTDSQPDEYLATQWTPHEGSMVTVPADNTVGVGRAAEGDASFPVHVHITHPVQEIRSMPELTAAQQAEAAAAAGGAARRDDTPLKLTQLAARHKCQDLLAGWFERGLTVDKAREEILERQADKGERTNVHQPAAEQLDLSERDAKEYSYTRAIMAAANMAEGKRVENCIEIEVGQDVEKRMPAEYKRRGGLFVPMQLRKVDSAVQGALSGAQRAKIMEVLTRAGGSGTIDSITANYIKEVVFTVYGGSMIEILRNVAKTVSMGAQVLTGLSSPVGFPVQTGDVTATWVAENSGSNVAASNVSTALVTLTPKTLMATTAYSRQLLVQSSVDVESMVRGSIAAKHALAWDLAALVGTGPSNQQPLGIYNATGVGTVDFSQAGYSNGTGATGQKIAYTGVRALELALASANALQGSLGFLTTPAVASDATQTLKFPGAAIAQGGVLWNGGIGEGEMIGYRAASTNQMPSTLAGTINSASVTTCRGLIFGNWADMIIGQFGGAMELIVDPYSLKKQGLIEVASFQMSDVLIRHPVSFAIADNLNA